MTTAPSKTTPARKRPTKTTAPRKVATAAAPVLEDGAEAGTQRLSSAFNLDTLEREGAKDEFAFIHKGREYVLTDPQEVDWQKLVMAVSNPIQFLRLVLRPEDVDAFFENSMPTWKLRALTDAYRTHFGLGELGESGGLSV